MLFDVHYYLMFWSSKHVNIKKNIFINFYLICNTVMQNNTLTLILLRVGMFNQNKDKYCGLADTGYCVTVSIFRQKFHNFYANKDTFCSSRSLDRLQSVLGPLLETPFI